MTIYSTAVKTVQQNQTYCGTAPKVETDCFSELLVHTSQTTLCNYLEGQGMDLHHHANPRSYAWGRMQC